MHVKKPKLWALAMNHAQARVVRGLGGKAEADQAEIVMKSEVHKLSDVKDDKPGRSFASAGGGRRSAIEPGSDPLAEETRAFIREVMALLESHHRKGDFDKLAIFAEHEVLGEIRKLLPASLAEIVVKEVPKNLLKLTARELESAILRDIGEISALP